MPKRYAGCETDALVVFNELAVCERMGDLFVAGGKSNSFKRAGAMTYDYAKELHRRLGALLWEYEAERGIHPPTVDAITLTLSGESCCPVGFEISEAGFILARGRVTPDVLKQAFSFLSDHLGGGGGNVIPLRRKG